MPVAFLLNTYEFTEQDKEAQMFFLAVPTAQV